MIPAIDVLLAYKATGLKPQRGNFYGPACCGVGALAVFNKCGVNSVYLKYECSDNYAAGFVNGFDGKSRRDPNNDYMKGYADGEAAYALATGNHNPSLQDHRT